MRKLKILTMISIMVLAVGMLLTVGAVTAGAENVWYFQITNAGDLVLGETFEAQVYFVNADNGDPAVGNDGKHNLNLYYLDISYNTDLLEYERVCYVDHYEPGWEYMTFNGGWLPSQPTEDPPGYLYDIMGIEDLDHQCEFYPDDALDPNSYCGPPCPGCPDRPFSHLATVKFTAKVTGHYDDLGMVWSAPDVDCLARVDYITYDQTDDFRAWTDGDVAKGTWQYPSYVLHLGVDEYGDDYFPQESVDEAWYTGPAAAKQTNNWMFGYPYNLYTETQDNLYNTYHTGAADQDMDTADVRTMIQAIKPVTTPSYAYNFVAESDDDEDMAIKRFIHWCDFNVQAYYPGGTDINEPNVPSLIVTHNNDYGYQWKTLRGFATSVDPCDDGNVFNIPDMTVYGLWLNDPATGGIGYNVYLTGDEFKATYEPVDGKYRSVCEPPEDIDEGTMENNLRDAEITYRSGKLNQLLANILTMQKAFSCSSDSTLRTGKGQYLQLYSDARWDDVIPGELLNSPDFKRIYSESNFRDVLKVADLDAGEEYGLAVFNQSGKNDVASIVLMVEEKEGKFRQATWEAEDQKYLPVSEKEALEIANKFLGIEYKPVEKFMKELSSELQYEIRLVTSKKFCQSPFMPMYEVSMNGGIAYVLQDRNCIVVKKPDSSLKPINLMSGKILD